MAKEKTIIHFTDVGNSDTCEYWYTISAPEEKVKDIVAEAVNMREAYGGECSLYELLEEICDKEGLELLNYAKGLLEYEV